MRKRIIFQLVVLVFQSTAAIAIVPFIPHLLQIWYNHTNGIWSAIYDEYIQHGRSGMVAEMTIIGLAALLTIAFTVWIIISDFGENNRTNRMLEAIVNKLGIKPIEYGNKNKSIAKLNADFRKRIEKKHHKIKKWNNGKRDNREK